MGKRASLVGQRFGRLLVVSEDGKTKHGAQQWKCACECSSIKTVTTSVLRSGRVVSCGCFSRDKSTTHGMSKSKTYKSWKCMKDRCNGLGNPASEHIYSKISYDPRWESFEIFLEDMGERPDGMTLDRIDGDQGYYRGNCRWATYKQQSLNRNNTTIVEWSGRQVALVELCEDLGTTAKLARERLARGWSLWNAVLLPSKHASRSRG